MQDQSTKQKIKNETLRILKENHEQFKTIDCSSFSNSQAQFYFVKLDQVSSTMLLSEKFNRDLVLPNRVICFIADCQTNGRGGNASTWASPLGNLYLTILSRSSLGFLPYVAISTVNSIIQAISKAYKLSLNITWIKDLFIDEKKVGGILIYSKSQDTRVYVEIGIGIQVKVAPSEAFDCIQNHIKQQVNIWSLIKSISILAGTKAISFKASDRDSEIERYQPRLKYVGKQVNILDGYQGKIKESGIFQGVNQYGFAKLKQADQTVTIIREGVMRPKDI